MRAFSASRLLFAGLVAAAAPTIANAESLDAARPGMLKAPAPNAAPVTPRAWDPIKKEEITGQATPGAKAETDLDFLKRRAAPLGYDTSSAWLRTRQLPTSGQRKTDVTPKRGIVAGTPKPDRGQVAMETLVIQNEGTKAPQSAALDDLPPPPAAPGGIASAPRAPSQAFNPTELRVTKTVPWQQQRQGGQVAFTRKVIGATK